MTHIFCKKEETFTKRELEIAYCSGLLNQKDLTIDRLSSEVKSAKFPMILEFIRSLRGATSKN